MKQKILADLKIYWGSFTRAMAVFGLSFFSVSVVGGMSTANLESSFIAGGLYMFVEIIRKYGIKTPHFQNNKTNFLLFP